MHDCIHHNLAENEHGYHRLLIKGTKQCTYLHRMVYAANMGLTMDDIKDVHVRHTCDNPRCVNPNHLVGGTLRDNMDDMVKRGRAGRKLDWATVNRIRKDLSSGMSLQATANKYGLAKSTTHSISKDKIWKTKYNPTPKVEWDNHEEQE